ncbi:MAG: ankyrin repeat domain-containing protein [Coxiellaceae bacterium]|nr:ankyrin repeat domain-containing protein [Coxiellaceae bacterium]
MSRSNAWSERRSLTLPNLLSCFTKPADFCALLQGDQQLLMTDTTDNFCPAKVVAYEDDATNEIVTAWSVANKQPIQAIATKLGEKVHAHHVRFSVAEVIELVDQVTTERSAIFFLQCLFSPLQFPEPRQATYVDLLRRQLAQKYVNDVPSWLTLQNHILTARQDALEVLLNLWQVIQQSVSVERFDAFITHVFSTTDIALQLLDQWSSVVDIADSARYQQLVRYFYLTAVRDASGHSSLPAPILAKVLAVWKNQQDAASLSALLFAACERGDAATLKALLNTNSKALVAAVNMQQDSLLLHKMIAMQEAGSVFDDDLIRDVLILTDNASLLCAQASPLMLACKYNRACLISMLLLHPEVLARINDQDDLGNTALHYVAMHGDVNSLNLLFSACLERGNALHLSRKNNKGETALHLICQRADASMLRFMLFNFDVDAVKHASGVKDNKRSLPIAYLPGISPLRELLETSDLVRYRIEDARRQAEAPVAPTSAAVPVYLSAPRGEKRREIYTTVKKLFAQWQGGDTLYEWLFGSEHRTRWTYNNPEVRRIIYSACEQLYSVTEKWQMEVIMSELRDKKAVMDDGVERSILRSSTVTDVQIYAGHSQSLPVTGFARGRQMLWWLLRFKSSPDSAAPSAGAPAAYNQFVMRAAPAIPMAQVVAAPPPTDDFDLDPKAIAFGDRATILAWASNDPVAVAVPPPRLNIGYPRLMNAAHASPSVSTTTKEDSSLPLDPAEQPRPSAPSMDPAELSFNDRVLAPVSSSPPPQDNEDPATLKQ